MHSHLPRAAEPFTKRNRFRYALGYAVFLVVALTISGGAFSVEIAPRISDREIVERLTRLEEGQRAIQERIDQRFLSIDERFLSMEKQIDQRFSTMREWIDQRFSAMQEQIDQRFLAMQEQIDQRFSAMQAQSEQRFSAIEKRSEQQFASLQRHMDAQWSLTLVLIAAIFGLIGFVVWDRKTAFKPLEERLEKRFQQVTGDVERELDLDSPHGSRLTRAIDVLRELAREDPRVGKALRRSFLLEEVPRKA